MDPVIFFVALVAAVFVTLTACVLFRGAPGPDPETPNEVTCVYCGWVHFPVTRAYAEGAVEGFNAYYDSLTPAQQEDNYGGHKSSIAEYIGCRLCGREDFRPSVEGDCPTGCTIGPVIYES